VSHRLGVRSLESTDPASRRPAVQVRTEVVAERIGAAARRTPAGACTATTRGPAECCVD